MAERLTWQQKLKKGLPLTDLEQVKYDATRMTLRRIRDNEEEQRIAEERKSAKYGDPELAEDLPKDKTVESEVEPKDSKKG